jgi:hypothetical protein
MCANALTERQLPMSNGIKLSHPSRTTTHTMNNNNLPSEITKHLINSGVKIIELPGGGVQLFGKYGSIMLTHDISTLQLKHIEQLCGVV